jgi:predicted nucleic acid-binding protein
MSRIVLDASAALRLVLGLAEAKELALQLERTSVVMVPGLYCSEVANGLWKYVNAGHFDIDEALARFDEALALADSLVPDRTLTVEALAEAAARQHPVYDLLYVVLARRHGARLLTLDARLSGLAADMGIGVG